MSAQIQIFGAAKSSATRKAERFFKERRIAFHRVDVKKKPPSPGELRRWIERFGVEAVLDLEARSAKEGGFAYLGGSDDDWISRMVDDPTLIRLPLVRRGRQLSVGEDPDGWQRMAEEATAEA